ncbi:uncharacterized protein LOC112055107 isoform X2 [Bicyclus anynana]|uniref:Uncharacterized protein LOC112055107 isoform X2 n=1 Tax=Bicyclus anynana TaxID=110368 RepID=A0A6J1P2V1_BICAN|nr:uncharacterized protein LOC112055107 isoform X2 [Bicyclus anynana]
MVTLSSRRRSMQTLLALLAVALACALARPPAVAEAPPENPAGPPQQGVPKPYPRGLLTEYAVPKIVIPRYIGNEEKIRNELPPGSDLIDQELRLIKKIRELERSSYPNYERWAQKEVETPTGQLDNAPYRMRIELKTYPDQNDVNLLETPFRDFLGQLTNKNEANANNEYFMNYPSNDANEGNQPNEGIQDNEGNLANEGNDANQKTDADNDSDKKYRFAITPLELAFFQNDNVQENATPKEEEEVESITVDAVIEQRKTRQNPNLSKTKTLISEHVDRLRTGLSNKDYRIPVSLLPTNLRWLKINRPNELEESTREDVEGTPKPHNIHILETPSEDASDSIYSVALIAAVGAALTVTIIGLAFGWYTLSKKAKAAAEVDYPAYGVTGPSVDSSGDKKLAQSAHIYHYQHQKQQIIAMERNGMDRNGSISDPESEDENEEGDYTVYECPGFATINWSYE